MSKARPRRNQAGAPAPRRLVRDVAAYAFVGLVAALAVAMAWAMRPWSEYSPFETARLVDPRTHVAAFRGLDGILPHRFIPARFGAEPFRRREAPLDVFYAWNGERKSFERFIEDAAVTGLLVVRDGVIVHERYRLGANAESRYASFEIASGVVGVLVGMAVQDGLIDSLDDAAQIYAPSLKDSEYGALSLRELLATSRGAVFSENYSDRRSDVVSFLFDAFVLRRDPNWLAMRVPLQDDPRARFGVASPNTQVLAAVVRAVYDRPLAEVVEDKLWGPAGMTSDASWSQNRGGPRGVAVGFCCLNATLQDYARLGEFLRREGAWGGERLLPETWVDDAVAAAGEDPASGQADAGVPWRRGLHLWVPRDARGEFLLTGAFGQYIWIDQRRGVVLVVAAVDPDWRARRAEAAVAFREIVRTVVED